MFWRRNSGFGLGLGLVDEENDTVMGGSDEARRRRTRTPPPTLPEFDEGFGSPTRTGADRTAAEKVKNEVHTVRRVASGFFGGEKMFDGIR